MPASLVGKVRFPSGYAPWYVYTATLNKTPGTITYLDMLSNSPGDGTWIVNVTTDSVLTTGYCFALEVPIAGQTTIQVAVPGSIIPMNGDDTLLPCCLVKFVYGSGVQSITLAAATDLAAGKVIGRFRNIYMNGRILAIPVVGTDVCIILTGAC